MTPAALTHRLDRTLVIEAPRETVFRFFTDSTRWATWWGAGSTIDARPGGRVLIRYPNAVEATGEVIEVAAPERIVFTYGYASGAPIAAGGSVVTVTLEAVPDGTRLRLAHDFADAAVRDQHVQGWRYQLSVFANVVADEAHGDADALAERWFAAWRETDGAARTEMLTAIAAPGVRMRDRFSAVEGIDELTQHIGAAHKFMPGVTLRKDGVARHCQGVVLADWTAAGADGQPRGRGTNVFVLSPAGRIAAVTGFWAS